MALPSSCWDRSTAAPKLRDNHCRNNYGDMLKEQDLEKCKPLFSPPAPTQDFNREEARWKEVLEVMKAARGSQPQG